MAHAATIDNKIIRCLSGLSLKKKKVLLTVVQNFAEDDFDLWDEMPDEIKKSVEKGLNEAQKGNGTPHEKVMKKLKKKWLKK